MKTKLTIFLILISVLGFGQDKVLIDTIAVDTIVPNYAEMTISEYYEFNQLVSEASGYKLGDKTERTYPMNPTTFGYDTDSVLKVIVCLEKHLLKYYSKALKEGNQIRRKDTVFENIEVEFIDQKIYNWFAEQYNVAGDKTKKWIFVNSTIDKDKAPIDIKLKTRIK